MGICRLHGGSDLRCGAHAVVLRAVSSGSRRACSGRGVFPFDWDGRLRVAQVLFFGSLSTLEAAAPLHAFGPDQRNALAMLLVRISHDGQTVFTMLYGVGTLVFGWLMYRSGFLPSVMGVLVMLAAGGFVAKAFTWVLTPAYSSPLLLAPAAIAFLIVSCWLVAMGIDVARWRDARRRES